MELGDVAVVLADLDGVLVDACEWHREAFKRALKQACGFELDEEYEAKLEAMTTRDKLKALVDSGDVPSSQSGKIWELKQTFTHDIIKQKARVDASKVELLDWLIQNRVRIACVTNSIRESTELMLTRTGQLDFIELIVSNQDVLHPKPCAEGYIRGMVTFGVMPDQVVIIEDSPRGLEAAYATGAHVMHVDNAKGLTKKSFIQFLEKPS